MIFNNIKRIVKNTSLKQHIYVGIALNLKSFFMHKAKALYIFNK